MNTSPVREGAILAPSNGFSWLTMTRDQAHILNQIIHKHRAGITDHWSPGIWDGLSQALCDIESAGGAYTRTRL